MTAAASAAAGEAGSRPATWTAWLYAALVSACLGYYLIGLPIQLSDSFGNMLKLDVSWSELLVAEFTQRAFLRPFLWGVLKAVYDVADGSYFAWYRGVHAAQVAVLAALFVHLLRPRTWPDAAVVSLGLAALIGSHTFAGTIREAFPVNTFLMILICCAMAAALSLGRYRWWNDLLAFVLFVFAALTVESGLLVAVIVVAGALAGGRGVSRTGLALVVAACAGYFVLRFAVLGTGSPGLEERASGFGFRVLEPEELQQRFGLNPRPFYAYNVVTSAMSVLLGEPRGGVFRFVWGLRHQIEPAVVVNVIASAAGTAVLGVYGWRRRRAWRQWALDHDDRLVLLFLAVLGANAAISYPYTKDVIMSPGGLFYALALAAAVRGLLRDMPSFGPARQSAVAACCLLLGVTWSIRQAGAHALLRADAIRSRNQWAYAEQWLERQNMDISDVRARALFDQLRGEAIVYRPAPPPLAIESPLFDVD